MAADDSFIVGLDIGGTFTDAAAVGQPSGRLLTAKTPTTPANLSEGLNRALRILADAAALPLESFLQRVERFAHATTQTSNVMFTWSGGPTGLITTRGFGDELLIMRARGRVAGLSVAERRHLSRTSKPKQVVPRERIQEVNERIDRAGNVIVALERAEVENAVGALLQQGVTGIAVCLLWSPRNPAHELLVEQVIRERSPSTHVSVSHRVAPVLGEYERAATTAVNAYVAPVVESYLRAVEHDLRSEGLSRPMMVIQADGGSTPAAAVLPVRTIESGPAAGMVGVKILSDAIGARNVIATDVGGTTFKVGLLSDGAWGVARETVINQYTLALPMVDLASIGAGGGSIAWVDGGRLRVGPESAAADPGPASYGLGGTRPTVTDADVVLGFIGTERPLGGRIEVRRDLAWKAIHDQVAVPLFGGDVIAAASAIRRIVDAQMTDLVRKTTLERGHDPRRFILMAYGGSGPVHAADYAAGLGIRRVIVPAAATVYSALGAAMSDIRFSIEEPIHETLASSTRLQSSLDRMEGEVRRTIGALGMASQVVVHYWADVRYERQLHSIRIALDRESLAEERVQAAFVAKYTTLYGEGALLRGVGIRVLRVGVDGIGEIEKAELPSLGVPDPKPARSSMRDVHWPMEPGAVATAVWDGAFLAPGATVRGPALVEYPGTTVVIPVSAEATVDTYGNVMLDLQAPA